jgi:hypothetical protein
MAFWRFFLLQSTEILLCFLWVCYEVLQRFQFSDSNYQIVEICLSMMSVLVFSWRSKVLLCVGVSISHTSDHIYDSLTSLHTNQLTMDTIIVFLDIIHLPIFI